MSLLYDPRDRATNQNPIPVLQRLQQEDPAHWCDPLKSWVFTRYDDVKAVTTNKACSADRLTPFYRSQPEEMQKRLAELIRYYNTWVAFKDPPEHTRLRGLMNKVFTHDVVDRLKPNVVNIVDMLIHDIEDQDSFDFITDFALPLPAYVIMDMLGVPRTDMRQIKDWSDKIGLFLGGATVTPNKYDLAREGTIAMASYFRGVIAEREKRPGQDLITGLLAIRDNDDALTEDEVIGTCMLFLFAGHETTTNLIGNGIRCLINHPDQLARLRRDPALIEPTVEEILRYDGPTGALVRVVAAEHEIHGKTLKEGERIFIMINAANHDPTAFEAPERFDISRDPNPHLTFNRGRHFCLGAPLARAEGIIAIGEIVKRMPDLALSLDEYEYMDTMVMRGVRSMPVHRTGTA